MAKSPASPTKATRQLLNTRSTPDWPTFFNTLLGSATDPRLKQFYSTSLPSGDTPLKDVEFVALDFETTGLDPKKDEIISIGIVPFTMKRIRCRDSAQWFVNPHRPLEEESVIIHGITDSEVENAPDLLKILEKVLDSLAGKIVVVHYKNIEREFMNQALQTRLNEGIHFPVIDTLAIESAIQQRDFGGFINRLKGNRPGSVRLGRSRQRYGLPAYQPHHAVTDALATAELLQAQIAYHFSPDTPLSELWL
ncbi:3'-5' exonuclease [Photobacterium sanctipauli]|uniref:DNA-directed DNA polymerase n=1 Tax=Photobacterium sanctipauli TaxID=1342794 RepID=A0A2T3NN65_9GAMM|nr:3'-5' exonuclease [Photobacterium sanctipauli]PSW16908.1 3'-5' exonuclease [Photobacterium sanctipauli]